MLQMFQVLVNVITIYGKINIPATLPPIYVREVWDYRNAKDENIIKKRYLTLFLTLDEKVPLLNQTLVNIFRNYIPYKEINSKYWQHPWMTNKT